MRYTRSTLKKLEDLFAELGYTIRYEKGNFQSGYCLVEQRKIAVVNKFFDTEGRINCLLDILASLTFNPDYLSEASKEFFCKMLQKTLTDYPPADENTANTHG